MLVLAVMLMHTSGESTNRKQSASAPWEWASLGVVLVVLGKPLCPAVRPAAWDGNWDGNSLVARFSARSSSEPEWRVLDVLSCLMVFTVSGTVKNLALAGSVQGWVAGSIWF